MIKNKLNAFVAMAKAYFFKFIKSQIVQIAIRLGLKVTGPMGWLLSLVGNKIAKYFWSLFRKARIFIGEFFETKKELKDYKNEINKPDQNPDDTKKAGHDFLNS